MSKQPTKALPYMQFFPTDWLADCDILSMSARGAWITFLCKAWQSQSGTLTLKIAQWSRIFGATDVKQAERIIAEIDECEIGTVEYHEEGRISLTSRRITRDLQAHGITSEKRSLAGQIAAKARWGKERNKDAQPPQTDSMQNVCESHTNAMREPMRSECENMQYQRPDTREERESVREDFFDEKSRIPEIVALYPKRAALAEAAKALAKHLDDGTDLEAVEAGTRAIAAVIHQLPSGANNRFVMSPDRFFRERRWEDDPETWKAMGTAGRALPAKPELNLGGRANSSTVVNLTKKS